MFSQVIIQVSVNSFVHGFYVGSDVFFEAINPLADLFISFLDGFLPVLDALTQ